LQTKGAIMKTNEWERIQDEYNAAQNMKRLGRVLAWDEMVRRRDAYIDAQPDDEDNVHNPFAYYMSQGRYDEIVNRYNEMKKELQK